MKFDEDQRSRIADAVRDRRHALGLSQEEVAGRSGTLLSTANLRVIESTGRESYRNRSLLGVARGLAWPDDAVERIARGADPATLAAGEAVPVGVDAAGPARSGQIAELQASVDANARALAELAERIAAIAAFLGVPEN